MNIKLTILALATATSILGFAGTTYAATSDNPAVPTNELNQLTQRMNNEGISPSVQQRLLNKMEQGQVVDADNPAFTQNLPSASFQNPFVSYTLPDGSVYQESITVLSHERVKSGRQSSGSTSGVTTQGTISGGSSTTGSGYVDYYGVQVAASGFQTAGSFDVDFYQTNGGSAGISRVYNALENANDGSVSNPNLQIVRASSTTNPNIPAEASLTFDFTLFGVTDTQTRYIDFYVTNSNYYENDNF